ncbi:MAG: 3-deoxy-manno-octulosonate cytidylyltransferase [Schleiferiaceae bacterium]|nr:3-deoxy-manno-octulosonate cytidylyltransferase [Schleiferiaceae bacterium]
MEKVGTLGIIPARYASSRLPGKPLADILGKPMIQHTYERARPQTDALLVATDDARIARAVEAFGGRALYTRPDHPSGSHRCQEAYQQWVAQGGSAEVIINIQGDEPLLPSGDVARLARLFKDPHVKLGTLAQPISTVAELENRSGCFLTVDQQNDALYFSRALIPQLRDVPRSQWLQHHPFYRHIGMYGYRPEALAQLAQLPPTPLEKAEKLEQLRWLEHGGRIRVAFTAEESRSVDTPEDLEAVRQILSRAHG